MLADVTNKRRTEVDQINGAVVSEAKKLGMEAPLNELMTNLIHAKEQLY
jgi:2-dehydropantoate 2-reductase